MCILDFTRFRVPTIILVVLVFVSPVNSALVTTYFEDFNDDFGSTITQDAGGASINNNRVDDTEAQTAFGPSPGIGPSLGLFPWTQVPSATVLADGALQLGIVTGGSIAMKGSTRDINGGGGDDVMGIGTYKWDNEWEAFYNDTNGGVAPNPPFANRSDGTFASPAEKRNTVVLMSDSTTGNTNAPTAGIQLAIGATADQGFTVRDMQTPGQPFLASYFCSGSEVQGLSCYQDGGQPEVRPWLMGSVPEADRLKITTEVNITEASAGVYHLALSIGPQGGALAQLISGLNVTAALSDVGTHSVPNGYWNIATGDAGTAKWDNLSYGGAAAIPEPSAFLLVGLVGVFVWVQHFLKRGYRVTND